MGLQLGTEHPVDVIAFLWASIALFEDDIDPPETVARYRPNWTELYSVTEARDRILRILGEGGDGMALGYFLPERLTAVDAGDREASLRLYSAWASTFSASLELARQREVTMAQDDAFADIHVSRMAGQRGGAGAVNVSE